MRSIVVTKLLSFSMTIISLTELVMQSNTSTASAAPVIPPTWVDLVSIADCAYVVFAPSSANSF